MRKGRYGGETGKKREKKEKTDDYSGHYVINSSRPPNRRTPERRPLERHTLVQICYLKLNQVSKFGLHRVWLS